MIESEQELLEYIELCLNEKSDTCILKLIDIIKTTDNIKTINTIALAFREIKDPILLPVLIDTLKRPETKNRRARITYACESFDCTAYLPFFIELALFDSGQTSLYAMDLIGKMAGPFPRHQVQEAMDKVNNFIKLKRDPERNQYLRKVLKFLKTVPIT